MVLGHRKMWVKFHLASTEARKLTFVFKMCLNRLYCYLSKLITQREKDIINSQFICLLGQMENKNDARYWS